VLLAVDHVVLLVSYAGSENCVKESVVSVDDGEVILEDDDDAVVLKDVHVVKGKAEEILDLEEVTKWGRGGDALGDFEVIETLGTSRVVQR
jgi:hypothetical protein